MEMKNNVALFSLIFLVVGVFVGWLIWGNGCGMKNGMGMHQMSDGNMMDNNGGMHDMMNGMMAGLEGKTGDAFDEAFLSEMIVHHEGAVVMAKAVLEKSKRPELTKLANDIISAQTGEIQMMQGWKTMWFKN
jgi:uncharacterized protein (DUF305 family)